jgi:hypothetical protein
MCRNEYVGLGVGAEDTGTRNVKTRSSKPETNPKSKSANDTNPRALTAAPSPHASLALRIGRVGRGDQG